jgi:hypothetical protein
MKRFADDGRVGAIRAERERTLERLNEARRVSSALLLVSHPSPCELRDSCAICSPTIERADA